MEKHVNLLSILLIISGVLGLWLAFICLWIPFIISHLPDAEEETVVIIKTVATGVSILIGIFALPHFIAGIWLRKRKEWARILVICLALLHLLNFPLGTALGTYSLVVLLKEETIQLFKKS